MEEQATQVAAIRVEFDEVGVPTVVELQTRQRQEAVGEDPAFVHVSHEVFTFAQGTAAQEALLETTLWQILGHEPRPEGERFSDVLTRAEVAEAALAERQQQHEIDLGQINAITQRSDQLDKDVAEAHERSAEAKKTADEAEARALRLEGELADARRQTALLQAEAERLVPPVEEVEQASQTPTVAVDPEEEVRRLLADAPALPIAKPQTEDLSP